MRISGKIVKANIDEHLVFGWASVATDANGNTVIDSDGDTISIDELEKAAYQFVMWGRDGGEMHENLYIGTLVESMVFTPEKCAALGIEGVPSGWWIGMKIFDNAVWAKIKSGKYSMFSIAGRAVREEVNI